MSQVCHEATANLSHRYVPSLVRAGIWICHWTSEPTFKGWTAREWFNARARKDISNEEFSLAVAALHFNFHSVLIEIPSPDAHGYNSKLNGMAKELLIWLNTEVLRRIDDHAFQTTAFEVTSSFHNLPGRDEKVKMLTDEMKKVGPKNTVLDSASHFFDNHRP